MFFDLLYDPELQKPYNAHEIKKLLADEINSTEFITVIITYR